jgi:thiamine-phosphate pyrophosphorylase
MTSLGADRRARLADARLYLCTDARRDRGDLVDFLDAVLANGVDIVQLREKNLEARQEIQFAAVFAEAAARHGALFSINDRADVAAVVHPDVLHLGRSLQPATSSATTC